MPRLTPPTVVRVAATLASKRYGIAVGKALMSDGRVIRFRVLSRNPVTVRRIGDAEPEDVEAVEAWFAAQGRAP